MSWDEEDVTWGEEEVESPVLTPSPLNRWTMIAGALNVVGLTVYNLGSYLIQLGQVVAMHKQLLDDKEAIAAAFATELESLQEENDGAWWLPGAD